MAQFNSLKYQVFRSTAMSQALASFSSDPYVLGTGLQVDQVRLEPITREALEASALWGETAALFPWESVPQWKTKDRKGFDISLWFGPELCGLCYASPRKSTICIKVILLEGKPDETHPLKGFVLALAMTAIGNYGRALGLETIEIEDPWQAAIPHYNAFGFNFDDEGRLVISLADA